MSWTTNKNKDLPFPIQRGSETEIKKAIADLEARGFECCFGPKLITENGERLGRYVKDKKKCILETTTHQKWMAKMRRKQVV